MTVDKIINDIILNKDDIPVRPLKLHTAGTRLSG